MKLGAHVKDRITGYEGCVTSRAVYLYGETKVEVTRASSEGKPESVWLCEKQVEQTAPDKSVGFEP